MAGSTVPLISQGVYAVHKARLICSPFYSYCGIEMGSRPLWR